jgi:DMSO/TMAO reductase YedYZ molybdopterin-dependent catalytic subunit
MDNDAPIEPVEPLEPSGGERSSARRRFIAQAASGTTLLVLGGVYALSDSLTSEARAQTRPDGRPRLPPGQRVISALKPMGGQPGDPKSSSFRLKVHGEVERPFELTFAELLALPQVTAQQDVHCVTGWSLLGGEWKGVRLAELAKRAGIKDSARHVVFEAAHGYTANVPRRDALRDNVMIVHQHDGQSLGRAHGAPVRSLVPELYFWKSAKWLTGIKFVRKDEPGYWETRGYHNHADPWREERYSA